MLSRQWQETHKTLYDGQQRFQAPYDQRRKSRPYRKLFMGSEVDISVWVGGIFFGKMAESIAWDTPSFNYVSYMRLVMGFHEHMNTWRECQYLNIVVVGRDGRSLAKSQHLLIRVDMYRCVLSKI